MAERSPTHAPRIDIPAHVDQISDVPGQHPIERRRVTEIGVRAPHPIVRERRLAQNGMEPAVDSDHVREPLHLIACQIGDAGVGSPPIDGPLARREKRRPLPAIETPRISNAKKPS